MEKNHKKSTHFFTKTRILFLVLSLFFLLAFFGFTLWVRTDTLRSFDFDTTVRFQQNTPLRFDSLFSALSVFGRFEYTATLLILLLAFIFFVKRKTIKRILGYTIVVFLFAGAHLFELVGKFFLHQPGPPNMFLRSQFSDFPGLYIHTDASYPSGHSLRIVFLGILISFLFWHAKFPKTARILSLIILGSFALAMLYSRITLGEHWATDVIGGSFLGASVGFLALMFL